ncbi:MAG: hypothetical protein Q8S00_32670 [Deltaproteobacteria bacterium]|nr:hypothetical protein [Deltaproteobacteria bacterium]
MSKAVKLYEGFHKYEPRSIGEFPTSFFVPQEAVWVGLAKNVMYRSEKLDPLTYEDEGAIDYIHEHGANVKAYRIDGDAEGPIRTVPKWIWGVQELVCLGQCLGFEYIDHDSKKCEGVVQKPFPDLYTTPDGRALLVIQGRKTVLALLWGGKLNVEPRGIVH